MNALVCDRFELSALITEAVEKALDVGATDAPRDILDSAGACEFLGVSRATLHRLRKEGLPQHRVGDSPRYLRSELLAWVEAS